MGTEIEVVVIGAGIVGCSIAYELARRGAAVRIADDRPAGMGATQASAGVLAPYIEAREEGPLLDLTARSLDRFDDFLAGVAESSGMTVGYRRTGTLDVVLHEEALRRLKDWWRVLEARGIKGELVDADRARFEEPHLTDEVLGGLMIPSHGFVAASALTSALTVAARRHGARFVEDRARRIRERDGHLVVEMAGSPLEADRVVLAAGSWSGQIEVQGAASIPIIPIRGQLLQLAWSGPPLKRVTWGERCYFVPWDDGTVLVGATVEDVGFDERTTVAGVRELIGSAFELMPHVCNSGFRSARAGLRPSTPDELPLIGPSTVMPNLMYATGHYRNGVLLAPLTAELVADSCLENRPDPIMQFTRPGRFGRL